MNDLTDVREDHDSKYSDSSATNGELTNESTISAVPLWDLFRFAKWSDILFMLLGTIMAIIAGSSLPIVFYLLGLIVTEFIGHSIVNLLSPGVASINSTDYFCNISDFYTNTFTATDIDTYLQDQVAIYVYYMIAVAFALFVSSLLSNLLWTLSALHQTKRMRVAFLEAVLRQDMGWYDLNPPTQLPTRLAEDIAKIEGGIGSNSASFIQEFVSLLSGLIIALALNWKLALTISVSFPLIVAVIIIASKITAVVAVKEQSALAKAGAIAEEVLSGIKTVMAFGGERKEAERYNYLLTQAKKESYKKQVIIGFFYGLFTLIFFSCFGLGFWYGVLLFVDCDVTPGDIVTITLGVVNGILNLGNALPLLASIAEATGSAGGIFSIIDKEPEINPKDGAPSSTLDDINGKLEFSDVVFSYPARPDVMVLCGLDLVINPGQTVALVGPSGSGKTTVLHLLMRLYNHSGGMITLDGMDIKELNVGWLRNQIGIVSQEPLLFNVSIAENIGLCKEGATMEEIVKAAKAANAYDFIADLPKQFDTLVGEGGAQLSGGQKQRIAIARALVRNPKILLLDEATSALDTESEKIVQQALDKAREGRTTIIIAHRLSTIQTADVIVGIKDGRVVEMGTHNELMDKEGLYFELVDNQSIHDEREITNTLDFQKAYRHSISRQHSQIQRSSSRSGHSILMRLPSSLDNIGGPRKSPVRPLLRRETSIFSALSRRVSEGLIPVSEINPIPHTPRSPKFSPRTLYSLDELFDEAPSTTVEHTEKQVTTKTLLQLNKPDWWLLLIGVTGFIVIGILIASVFILLSQALQIFSELDKTILIQRVSDLSGVYVALGFLGFLVLSIATITLNVAADRLTDRLRQQSFEAMLRQDLTFFDEPENAVSILINRLTVDASEVNQVTGLRLGICLRAGVNLLASYIIALEASWPLGLIALPSLVIFVIAGVLQMKLTKLYINKSSESQHECIMTAVESIGGVFTVSSLGIEEKLIRKYKKQLEKPFGYDMKSTVLQSILLAITQSASLLILAGGFVLASHIYTSDSSKPYHANLDQVFRALGAIMFTSVIFKELFRTLPDTENAKIAAENILSLLSKQPLIDAFSNQGATPKDEESSIIKLLSAQFYYPSRPEIDILQGLSLSIKPGKTVALVGTSGSGKSTVLSLIERFYDLQSGTIMLNRFNIRALNVSWLRRQISLVPQEPVLFDMSIGDNIRYGANYKELSDEEIIEAAKAANIHDFIQTLPQGYDTNVGSKGMQLSGGQKQRIAIARALVRNPKILLLDEATSALDTESEKTVQEALDKAREGRTTIIIAHRLSTISNADNIAVLHKGAVIEQGTHSQLMRKKGAYYFMNNVNETNN